MPPHRPEYLGDVIAERKLSVEGRPELDITVRFGKPRRLEELYRDGKDNGDMFCPFQILGIGDDRIHYSAGVDAVQALQLVMKKVTIELGVLKRDHGYEFRWLDDTDLGFPNIED